MGWQDLFETRCMWHVLKGNKRTGQRTHTREFKVLKFVKIGFCLDSCISTSTSCITKLKMYQIKTSCGEIMKALFVE